MHRSAAGRTASVREKVSDCLGTRVAREPRALPRTDANELSGYELPTVVWLGVRPHFLERLAHYHRLRRSFGVTLVVRNEDAGQKYFQDGGTVAR